jgi:hypothetical protein
MAACALPTALATPTPLPRILVHTDGADRTLATEAATVRLALAQAEIALEPLDRVEPPLWQPISDGLRITVTRVLVDVEERRILHEQQVVRDEFLEPAASHVVEAGHDGLEQFTFHSAVDGSLVISRALVSQVILVAPRTETWVQGTKGTLPAVPFSGTLAYIGNGDAWVMRQSSAHKRRLTDSGDLDGRVFELAPDARTLLYTAQSATSNELNTLWTVDTELTNAHPVSTGLTGILWAAWRPQGGAWAMSSARSTAGAPGWRALNDLELVSYPGLTVTHVLSPTALFDYAWWGERWWWAPDGQSLAYARADEVGIAPLDQPQRQPALRFPPYRAPGDWVWLAHLAWSADGARLAALVHQGLGDDPAFSCIELDLASGAMQTVLDGLSPWSAPVRVPTSDDLLLGQPAVDGLTLALLTRRYDGSWSAPEPFAVTLGSLEQLDLATSPTSNDLVIAQDGDLFLARGSGSPLPLTASGLASHPRWR